MKYEELFRLRRELIKKKVKDNNLTTFENEQLKVINSQIKNHNKKIDEKNKDFYTLKDRYKDNSAFVKGFQKAFKMNLIVMYNEKEGKRL